jgi:hypothetical protein
VIDLLTTRLLSSSMDNISGSKDIKIVEVFCDVNKPLPVLMDLNSRVA